MKVSVPTWELLLRDLNVRIPLETQNWLLLLRFADEDARLLEGPAIPIREPKTVH